MKTIREITVYQLHLSSPRAASVITFTKRHDAHALATSLSGAFESTIDEKNVKILVDYNPHDMDFGDDLYGDVYTVGTRVFKSLEEYQDSTPEGLKKRALSKLTEEERKALGF